MVSQKSQWNLKFFENYQSFDKAVYIVQPSEQTKTAKKIIPPTTDFSLLLPNDS